MGNSYGTINANMGIIHYDQTNNIFEQFLHDLKTSGQTKFFLETCNMSAAACAAEAVGARWKYQTPIGPDGRELYGQDDFMAFFLYSMYGQKKAPIVKDGICENEVKENIAWVLTECASVVTETITASDGNDLIKQLDAALFKGKAVVLSYLTDYNSGHFITLVERNPSAKTFTIHDSWKGNNLCKKDGDREVYPDSFFISRCVGDRLRFITVCRKEA